MFLDVFVFISGVCVWLLSHLLGSGVFPPLLVTFKIRFDDSWSRRWRPRTHRFSLLRPAQQCGSAFAFELRLLGLVLGLVLGLAGVRYMLITLILRASRPSTYPFRAVAPVASAWRRPSGLRRVRGGRIIPVRTEAPAFLACLVHTPPRWGYCRNPRQRLLHVCTGRPNAELSWALGQPFRDCWSLF